MAKKKKAKKKPRKLWLLYNVAEGSVKRANRTCPKCGQAVFMGKHADRWHCGKCGYVEMIK